MKYIDLHPFAARQSIFKMCLSDRSDGKSTEMSALALETYLQTGKAGVFARRFGTEFDEDFFNTFENNLRKEKDEKHFYLLKGRKFKIKGSHKKGFHAFITDEGGNIFHEHPTISFYPLSMSGRKKSAFAWETHKNIYVDEYIPLDGIYLRTKVSEAEIILEWYKTIDRKHYDNYVMIAGNKMTRFNPVFEYFNITEWKQSGVTTFQNGRFDLLVWRNKENAREEEKSPFGELVNGTKYAGYNCGGFLSDDNVMIKKEHSKVKFCEVITGNYCYAAYYAPNSLVFAPCSLNRVACDNLCVRTCESPTNPIYGAIWIDAPQARDMRNVLSYFKHNNGIFFDSEMTAQRLKKFYNKI